MSIVATIQAIGVLKDLLPAGSTVLELAGKFLDGRASREELEAAEASENLSAEVHLALAQIKLNTAAVTHPSIFVAGWRSCIGWVGALILAFNYIIFPFATAFGLELPILDLNAMMPVILGMLGVSASRSYEKVRGVARDNLKPQQRPDINDF